MNRLKKEALKVIAAALPAEEIAGLKEMFEAMDKDGRCARGGCVRACACVCVCVCACVCVAVHSCRVLGMSAV
jgi:hypothetical protein